MQNTYTPSQLNKIAADNYDVLRHYCSILEAEGYWEGPESVLHKSIYEILDSYIQSVLIQLSIYCEHMSDEEASFIANLPVNNVFEITSCELDSRVLDASLRIFKSPPILFQVCGLRDSDKKSGMLGLFFDALLNIQLAMAFLSSVQTAKVTSFIKEFFGNVEMFMYNAERYSSIISQRYIFMKLCNSELENSSRYILQAGEDFEKYKNDFLQISDSVPKKVPKEIVNEASVIADASAASDASVTSDSSYDDNQHDEPCSKVDTALTEVTEVHDEKIIEEIEEIKKTAELDRLMGELNTLVGLEDVKNEINSLVNLIKIRKLREKAGLPELEMSYHMVFTGSAGTGKTTVARLVAGIYKELGVLSKGQLIETDRSGLVAGYVGQTAIKTREACEKAYGGVLFIDEAYSLSAQSGGNDFGDEAIDMLVKIMEDHRKDLVVIVAGYTKEMQRFLKANTGLKSRFNKFIDFPDYSDDELMDILECMSKKSGFRIDDDAKALVREHLETMTDLERKEFGNARGIRNMFEKMLINQANRLVSRNTYDLNNLSLITKDDLF